MLKKIGHYSLIVALLLMFLLSVAVSCRAEVKGVCSLKGISFIDRDKTVEAVEGSAVLKNEKDETVADGDLSCVDGFVAACGKKGVAFAFTPLAGPLPENTWLKGKVKEFAAVELTKANTWSLKDNNLYFFIEMPVVTLGINILLDASLARASMISFPKGDYNLWGYTITIGEGGGRLKFLYGKIIDGSNAVVKGTDQKIVKYGKKK
jgi:hypothetical protein